MCVLKEHLNNPYINGYKVVAKRNDSYFSLAMGFKYVNGVDIPIVKRQIRLTSYFYDDILNVNRAYNSYMEGRTAIFDDELAAKIFLCKITSQPYNLFYTPVVVKARISKDIMQGVYDLWDVYAGRRIKILKEIPI
jgi:hypothetical protein